MENNDMPRRSAARLPGNLFTDVPSAALAEVFTLILSRRECRVERIASLGQVTPVDQPYCQAWDEWVLLLAGAARVEVEGAETVLAVGDYLLIPAGARHRVTFTEPARPTVWLALHFDDGPTPEPAGSNNGDRLGIVQQRSRTAPSRSSRTLTF